MAGINISTRRLDVVVQPLDDFRLLRDQAERGRSAASVVAQYLATGRPGHERLTEPSRTHADFVVADATAAVRLEDPQAVVRLAAPVLAHPLLQPLLEG